MNGLNTVPFVTYNKDGRIINCGFVPVDMLHLQQTDDLKVLQAESHWETQYVINDQCVDRPVNPAIINSNQIINLPKNSKIYINGTKYNIDENEIELEFEYPGEYSIKIECFPYLDIQFKMVKL